MLGLVLKAYKNMMAASLRENNIDLSFEQFITLMFLSIEEDPIQQNIANQLQKDKSIILRHTNVLIEKQYVIRVVDENDRRRKKLILTPKGSETVSRIKNIEKHIEDQLVSGINPATQRTFVDVLTKIHSNSEMEEEYFHCK